MRPCRATRENSLLDGLPEAKTNRAGGLSSSPHGSENPNSTITLAQGTRRVNPPAGRAVSSPSCATRMGPLYTRGFELASRARPRLLRSRAQPDLDLVPQIGNRERLADPLDGSGTQTGLGNRLLRVGSHDNDLCPSVLAEFLAEQDAGGL